MLQYIWGQSNGAFKRYCDLANNQFVAADSDSEGCIYCQNTGCLGLGDKVEPLIPDLESIEDVPTAQQTHENKQSQRSEESRNKPTHEGKAEKIIQMLMPVFNDHAKKIQELTDKIIRHGSGFGRKIRNALAQLKKQI